MTASLRGLAYAALAAASWAMIVLQAAAEPSALVLRAVCKPVFTVDRETRASGAGFLVERLGSARQTFLFTAQHLFPSPASEIASHATQAQCRPPSSTKTFITGPAAPISGAHPMGPPGEFRDVAAFPVRGFSPGMSLATADVHPGEEVWLVAKVAGGKETATWLHRARVLKTEGFLAYRYDDQTLNADQTSGAAIVNASGEIVGLNVGYTRTMNNDLVGVGDRLSTLQEALRALP